jgi:Kef-type K+ transport system membrane component KefB
MTTTQIISICIAISSILFLLYIGVTTDILKAGTNRPYSFHKFQLWIWTLVICPCFVLNWGFINENYPTLNLTALILLGISSATTLTAEVINTVHLNSRKENEVFKVLNGQSKSFLIDILTDESGELSIGRLQQFIFTIVYIVIYISMFFPNKIYPELDTNAFVLMGISTGTFLIGKSLKK